MKNWILGLGLVASAGASAYTIDEARDWVDANGNVVGDALIMDGEDQTSLDLLKRENYLYPLDSNGYIRHYYSESDYVYYEGPGCTGDSFYRLPGASLPGYIGFTYNENAEIPSEAVAAIIGPKDPVRFDSQSYREIGMSECRSISANTTGYPEEDVIVGTLSDIGLEETTDSGSGVLALQIIGTTAPYDLTNSKSTLETVTLRTNPSGQIVKTTNERGSAVIEVNQAATGIYEVRLQTFEADSNEWLYQCSSTSNAVASCYTQGPDVIIVETRYVTTGEYVDAAFNLEIKR